MRQTERHQKIEKKNESNMMMRSLISSQRTKSLLTKGKYFRSTTIKALFSTEAEEEERMVMEYDVLIVGGT